jgi:hypothetical protein
MRLRRKKETAGQFRQRVQTASSDQTVSGKSGCPNPNPDSAFGRPSSNSLYTNYYSKAASLFERIGLGNSKL